MNPCFTTYPAQLESLGCASPDPSGVGMVSVLPYNHTAMAISYNWLFLYIYIHIYGIYITIIMAKWGELLNC